MAKNFDDELTKGPWKVWVNPDGEGGVYAVESEHFLLLRTVGGLDDVPPYAENEDNTPYQKAVAELAASAPDLKRQRDELLALIERINTKCHRAITVEQALADLHDIEWMTSPDQIGGAS